MLKMIFVILVLLLSACEIPYWELDGAISVCKEYGGIYLIDPKIGMADFHCKNGEIINITRPHEI